MKTADVGRINDNGSPLINLAAQVLLFKTSKEAGPYAAGGPIQIGREHVSLVLSVDATPADFQQRLARLLIESNTDRMPADPFTRRQADQIRPDGPNHSYYSLVS